MTSPNRGAVNIGELIHRGLPLYTCEVVALLQGVCSRAEQTREDGAIRATSAADLWVTIAGELSILPSEATATAAAIDPRAQVAALLEELLPPVSELPEYRVPSSLRSLPARLRASIGAVATSDPKDLLAILRLYLKEDAGDVLQRLVVRAAKPESGGRRRWPDPAASNHPAPAAAVTAVQNDFAEALDLFTHESETGTTQSGGVHVDDAPELSIRAEHQPPPAQGRRSRTIDAAQAAAALAVVLASGFAGYAYVRRAESSHTRGSDRTGGRPQFEQAIDGHEPSPGSSRAPDSPDRTTPEPRTPGAASPLAPAASSPGDAAHALLIPVADGAFSPSFAPTGDALFFHSGRTRTGRLLAIKLDDQDTLSGLAPVLEDAAKNYHPRLSPDGRLLAFDSDRDGERGVYVSDRDGAHARRVSGRGFATAPSWSPDMKSLTFVRAEAARPRVWNLWMLDLTSGALTRTTSFESGQVWAASWFPDARRVCYSHEDRLVVMDIASGTRDVFSTPRPRRLVRTPAVSPDGTRIIFQVLRDGVWLLDLRTRSMRRILDDVTAEEFAWDPEGRRVAYHSRQDGEWRIWIATPPAS